MSIFKTAKHPLLEVSICKSRTTLFRTAVRTRAIRCHCPIRYSRHRHFTKTIPSTFRNIDGFLCFSRCGWHWWWENFPGKWRWPERPSFWRPWPFISFPLFWRREENGMDTGKDGYEREHSSIFPGGDDPVDEFSSCAVGN